MKNALILHGTMGHSRENWFPWLKSELRKMNYEVWLPDLPDSDVPNLKKYNEFILSNKDFKFDSETVLIGHSSGAVAILGLLNELPSKAQVGKCILVSPFDISSNGGTWAANRELFEYKPDLSKIKKRSKQFILLISDDDPYCPVPYVKKLGKKLGGKVVVTKQDGHFSAGSGGPKYKKLPILLKYL